MKDNERHQHFSAAEHGVCLRAAHGCLDKEKSLDLRSVVPVAVPVPVPLVFAVFADCADCATVAASCPSVKKMGLRRLLANLKSEASTSFIQRYSNSTKQVFAPTTSGQRRASSQVSPDLTSTLCLYLPFKYCSKGPRCILSCERLRQTG